MPEIEEFWSILIMKQYFAEMCFCGTLARLGLSWINKYDNTIASRWHQVPVLINDSLNHLYQTICSERLIQ